MSVANAFNVMKVYISDEHKVAYTSNEMGIKYSLPFTFRCKADVGNVIILFNMKSNMMVFVVALYVNCYSIVSMKFYVVDDLPVPSVKYFLDQDHIIATIRTEFQDKLASYTLDCIINSP
jgi:hypothetical protein